MHLFLMLYFPLHQYTQVMISQVIISSASLPVQHVLVPCLAYQNLVRIYCIFVYIVSSTLLNDKQTVIHCNETSVKYHSYKQTVLEDYFKLSVYSCENLCDLYLERTLTIEPDAVRGSPVRSHTPQSMHLWWAINSHPFFSKQISSCWMCQTDPQILGEFLDILKSKAKFLPLTSIRPDFYPCVFLRKRFF